VATIGCDNEVGFGPCTVERPGAFQRTDDRQLDIDYKYFRVVARDGFPRHYTILSMPLDGIRLDPRFEIT
jgi:hypothetical protein